jgi:hypothetical protein
MFSGLNL